MNESEKKLIEFEAAQKHNTDRLDKLTGTVEDIAKEQAALVTVTEVQSQQIGMLLSLAKVSFGMVFLAVGGAVLKLVVGG